MDWIHPRIGLDWVILCNTFCGFFIGSDGENRHNGVAS